MKTIKEMTAKELSKMAKIMYGSFVRGVVDIKKNILVFDSEMHADEKQLLLQKGSYQNDLWNINLPDTFGASDFY